MQQSLSQRRGALRRGPGGSAEPRLPEALGGADPARRAAAAGRDLRRSRQRAGRRATCHWLYLDQLRELGADAVGGRFVEDGRLLTAAGVSAGIDMALHLVGREAGAEAAQRVQLGLEYDPQPPFDAGSPEKAPPAVVEALRSTRLTPR
jgi:hypothetical protein